jgi:hypothetical protein
VDQKPATHEFLSQDAKLDAHEPLRLSGSKTSDASALEHPSTHSDEPYSIQSPYLNERKQVNKTF